MGSHTGSICQWHGFRWLFHEFWGNQFKKRAHVNAIEAGPHDGRAAYPHMHLFCASVFLENPDQLLCGCTTHDAVIDQKNPFAFQDLLHQGIFALDLVLTAPSFDKSPSYITV